MCVWDFITPSADNTWISLSSGNFSKREVVNWKSLDFIQRKERKSFKIMFCASRKWVFGLASQAQLKYNILIPILSVQVEHRGSNHLFSFTGEGGADGKCLVYGIVFLAFILFGLHVFNRNQMNLGWEWILSQQRIPLIRSFRTILGVGKERAAPKSAQWEINHIYLWTWTYR